MKGIYHHSWFRTTDNKEYNDPCAKTIYFYGTDIVVGYYHDNYLLLTERELNCDQLKDLASLVESLDSEKETYERN